MDIINISILVVAFINLLLGYFVFKRGKVKAMNISYGIFSIGVTLWSLTMIVYRSSVSEHEVLIWCKFLYTSPVVIIVPIFYFIYLFAKERKKTSLSFVSIFSVVIAIFFILIIIFSDLVIKSIEIIENGENIIYFGSFYIFYIFYVSGYFLGIYFVLFSKYRKSNGIFKSQIFYVFWGSVLGSSVGLVTNLLLPTFGYFELNWLGQIATMMMTLFIGFSIVRFRMMDLKFVLRRSSVYILSLSMVLFLATGFKYLFSSLAIDMKLIDELFIIFIVIVVFPHIREYFSYISNKYFFASLYNSQEVIARFSDKLSTTLEIDKLLESIASEVNKSFYPKSMSIFLFNEKDSKFYTAFSAGNSFEKRSSFDLNNNILSKYIKDKNILIMHDVREKSEDDYQEIQKIFLNKNIEIIVPLSIKDKDVGLYLMGQKESGDHYNDEDIQLLQVLATQSAFALDNSLKFEEAKNFNILLEREVEKAVMELQKANGELRTLDTAKSDFISIASHQLRTPLTVIKGYVSMILEGNFGKLPDIAREPTEKIYDSNERLIKLVEQLLSISRIESGRIKYQFEETNLSELVSGIMEGIRYNAIKKGLDLSYSPPKGFAPMVDIDAVKIRQIITSLIDNSIKYTHKTDEKRGFILIRIEDIKEKDRVRFVIEDNGIGIKEGDKINLFKKFSRGRDISTVYTEGTGLGLYVAKKIIEAHNGHIYAESKGRNMGTKIYFDLPKIEKEK